jgi:cytoskeleton protein RodZ
MNLGSDEVATTGNEQPGSSAAAAQTPGALLEQERKRRGMSIQEAAEGLHLDTWIVEAIEANRFLALGAPVYAKGYLRKYAELLGLAPDVIVARYDGLTDTLPEPTPIPVITTTPPTRPKWPKYIAWTLLVALLIGIGFVVLEFVWPIVETRVFPDVSSSMTTPSEPTPSTPIESTASTAVATPTIVEAAEAASEGVDGDATLAQTTQVSQPAETPVPAPAAAPQNADAGSARLTLEFGSPSWVEVHDAAGGRLMYDVAAAGSVHTMEGRAPLNVVIGVAAAVKVRVNDREIVVPRRANRESTRFVVAADGSVQ